MTNTYPFTVLGDEFKGKRVLVTWGTKGMGAAMVLPMPEPKANEARVKLIECLP